MYISGIENMQIETPKNMVKSSIVNFSLAFLCAVFYIIYTQFSYGVDSLYMRYMFVPTFTGSALCLFAYLAKLSRFVTRISYNLWNAAAAVVTCGLMFKGIVSISGRFTTYERFYWVAAGALALASIVIETVYIGTLLSRKEKNNR